MEPSTKQELVDGITKYWAKNITVENCNKHMDHVRFEAI